MNSDNSKVFFPGDISISIVMISLNEGHHLEDIVKNLSGWAKEIFLVDSYSKDNTIDKALELGIKVVQRKFQGFGDQWNFAIESLPLWLTPASAINFKFINYFFDKNLSLNFFFLINFAGDPK